MTQSPLLREPPPSWTVPIVVGAVLTVLLQMPQWALAVREVGGLIALPCCCAVEIVPIGIVPAWLARRANPALTVGQGFAVSFVAALVGTTVLTGALLALDWSQLADLEALREAVEKAVEDAVRRNELPQDVDAEEVARGVAEAVPYAPWLTAPVVPIASGVFGLLTVALMPRRQMPEVPPPA